MALGLIIPQVDLSLLMPSITQCNNDTTTPIGGEDSLENSMDQLTVTSAFSVGDLDRADTPQNTLLTGKFIFMRTTYCSEFLNFFFCIFLYII